MVGERGTTRYVREARACLSLLARAPLGAHNADDQVDLNPSPLFLCLCLRLVWYPDLPDCWYELKRPRGAGEKHPQAE